jgi:LuxR family transcriptional regulator, maltose regulon positive regulatory protein
MNPDEKTYPALLQAGTAALSSGAWQAARGSFEAALQQGESAEALEGLGMAAWWLDDGALTFSARERAYLLYHQQGDRQGAARMAIFLAYDCYSFRGEYAIANGWFRRAERLLAGLDPLPEHSMLAIYEGVLTLGRYSDASTTLKLGAHARQLARSLQVIDLEMLALALEGLARICIGDIAEGMRCLDEATLAAVSGEMTDPDACASTCCFLIYGCELVRDFDRAAQWCRYVQELSARLNYALMFSLCRTHYAGILIWRGEWAEAEVTLASATGDLISTRPAEAADGIVRLAELRRLQGRFAEAAALLNQAETPPYRMLGANQALLGRAALAFDQGQAAEAANLAGRFLRSLPEENRLGRAKAIELLAFARLELGHLDQAAQTCAELRATADAFPTGPLRAAVSCLEGVLAAGRGDLEAACQRLQDAVDLYKHSGAPFETAQARVHLSKVLLQLGRNEAARQQAQKAHAALRKLGAVDGSRRAAALLRELEAGPNPRGLQAPKLERLTPREMEILRLIAAAKSNREIAALLVVSIRTVERHILNLYRKLGASGPAARAAAAAYYLQHSLPPPPQINPEN